VRPQIEFLCKPFQFVKEKTLTTIHGGTLKKTSFREHHETLKPIKKHLPKGPCVNTVRPHPTHLLGDLLTASV
jgi:hypothetical protein